MVVHTLALDSAADRTTLSIREDDIGQLAHTLVADRTTTPCDRVPSDVEIDEAIDLINAQARIAVRRGIGSFLMDHAQDQIALQVAAEAMTGELNRRLHHELMQEGGEQTIVALLSHNEPPLLIGRMLNRVRSVLIDRWVQLINDSARLGDRRGLATA